MSLMKYDNAMANRCTLVRITRFIAYATCIVISVCGGVPSASGEGLRDIRGRYNFNIDTEQISISGVSAGGWIANQFHIAHSEMVIGAGILAAGPYHCAGSSSIYDACLYQIGLPHDACESIYYCSSFARANFGILGVYLGPPNLESSIRSTLAEASNGTIAPLEKLRGDRVWLFSGTKDRMVPTEVVRSLQQYYLTIFQRPEVRNPESNVYLQINADGEEAEHGMIVDDPSNPKKCDSFGEPFINNCNYDAVGKFLKFIYAPYAPALIEPQQGVWDRSALLEFDQTAFFDASDESTSMNQFAHIFVPKACQQGARCRLHVAFHGCLQDQQHIKEECEEKSECPVYFFFRDAGYNEWADANNIVVLYPQNAKWGNTFEGMKNPGSCWDWWGYSGPDYFRRTGKQISAVKKMVDCVTGMGSCP